MKRKMFGFFLFVATGLAFLAELTIMEGWTSSTVVALLFVPLFGIGLKEHYQHLKR